MSGPRSWRAILVLAKYGVRRWLNRASVQMVAAFRKKKTPGRTATSPKGRKGGMLALAIVLSLGFGALMQGANLVGHLSAAVKSRELAAVGGEAPGATQDAPSPWPSAANWPAPGGVATMVRVIGLVLAMEVAAVLLVQVGSLFVATGSSAGSGQLEWDAQWLFTFPVRARTLFLARVLEHALLNAYSYFLVVPLLLAAFWTAGYGWRAIPLALAFTIGINLLLSAVRVVLETWLRLKVSRKGLGNIQAVCSVLGLLGLFFILYLAQAKTPPVWLADFADRLPAALLWLPPFAPAEACLGGMAAWLSVACMVGAAAVAVGVAVHTAQWLVRKGLIAASGTYQGSRKAHAAKRGPARWSGGVLSKEILLLLRDRNRLVGVLVVPLLLIGFHVFLRTGGVGVFRENFAHAAALAFGVGATVMLAGALPLLAVEQKSLWLVYTSPKPLHAIFLQKTRLWIGIGLAYAAAVLVAAAFGNRHLHPGNLLDAASALIGVAIYGLIAAGLGILGTDVRKSASPPAPRVSFVYLYMLLGAMYLPTIYSASLWDRIGPVVLSAMLAVAIWQKVRDVLPFLLDPVESPSPRVSMIDGVIAVFAFFLIQGSVSRAAAAAEATAGVRLLAPYLVAGVLVATASLLVFWRRKVPGLLKTLGIRRDEPRTSLKMALGTGIAGGLGAGVVAVGYLAMAARTAPLHEALRLANAGLAEGGLGFALLSILAVPLVEEYIFRGVLLRSMLGTLPRSAAILGSAAVFALVYPPVLAVPIFFLGIATATIYARTRWLPASLAVHAIFSAAMLLAGPFFA